MTGSPTATAAPERLPSVLAVLVVRDAAAWLRETLASLAAQSYPRLAVLAVDNASGDGSRELLEQALGDRPGHLAAGDRGARRRVEGRARAPGRVGGRLRVAAPRRRRAGPRRGPQAGRSGRRDRGRSRRCRGRQGRRLGAAASPARRRASADLFGHAYAPLQPGEIDQGQFDRVLEVLCVSSSAMLIVSRGLEARRPLRRTPRRRVRRTRLLLARPHVAGFRVLMTPLARARHRAATAEGERATAERDRSARVPRGPRGDRLDAEELQPPVAAVDPAARGDPRGVPAVVPDRSPAGSRKRGTCSRHGDGTSPTSRARSKRRRRVQKMRRAKDRQLRRFMESAGLRLPRWFQTAERILEEQRAIDDDEQGEPVSRRLRDRTASLVGTHPVIVASFFGLVIGRGRRSGLPGRRRADRRRGRCPRSRPRPAGSSTSWCRATGRRRSADRCTASPALAALGGLSWLAFASTSLAQKVVLAGAPALAAILMYRAAARADRPPERLGARGGGLRAVGADAVGLLAGPARPAGGARGPARRRRAARGRVRRETNPPMDDGASPPASGSRSRC